MAWMGMTVAHELCHFFIGYLSGYILPTTPPGVKYLERDKAVQGGEELGESGRWWEANVFGGEVRFLTEPLADLKHPSTHPLGDLQAGDLWIMSNVTTLMTVIDRKSITGILNFGM